MAKGSVAKSKVAKMLADAFGKDFIGEYDKKYYVQAEENGEMVQVAIALTCPKNPVAVSGYVNVSAEMNFEDDDNKPKMITTIANSDEKLEITKEEENNIADMMRRLGL